MTLGEHLVAFRATHDWVQLRHGTVAWRYYRGGQLEKTVLLLGGALGIGEVAFLQNLALERHFHVISPDYPPIASVAQLIDGLVAILDAEAARRAHIVGGSFGGLLAQALVRRAPERVTSLVLSHTMAPDPRRRARATSLLSLLPAGPLRTLMKSRLATDLGAADPFWREYFDRAVASLSKGDILTRIRLEDELVRHAGYTPDDVPHWEGPVLIQEVEDELFRDTSPVPAALRLRALYPQAEVHNIGTMSVSRPDEYAAVLLYFLLGAA